MSIYTEDSIQENDDGNISSEWQVIISNKKVKEKLISIGDKLKEKYAQYFDELKSNYVKAVLTTLPKHLHKMKRCELQYIFNSDETFIMHCIDLLLYNVKLKPPKEDQRAALSMLIITE